MADRYWVGGTGTWDATSTTHWSATSGGASGASVPTASDIVFFDELSNATAYTVTCTGTLACSYLHMGPALAGNITWAGTAAITITDGLDLAWGMGTGAIARTYTGALTFNGSNTGNFIFTNGVSLASAFTINGTGDWTLAGALTTTGTLTVTQGTFTTNNYSVAATAFNSTGSLSRTVSFGSSTITLSSIGTILQFTPEGLVFNCGTSTITASNTTASSVNVFRGGAQTFYDLTFTSSNPATVNFQEYANTFRNVTIAGRAASGVKILQLEANQTITGTLTISAGSNATMRTFVRSSLIGATRTLTCAAIASLSDIDFRDIAIAGAAAPVSGTRLGDCKGNSGITFGAGKTVYWRSTISANWGGVNSWSATSGGAADVTQFPLAQDTAVFPAATYPASGATATIDAAYNIGTIDMSLRTSNTMTLAGGTSGPNFYGNWINGTGTTISGTTLFTFAGQGSQTITSAGRSFTQQITTNSPGGSVTLQDAYSGTSLAITSGTFAANNYNVTLSGLVTLTANTTRTIDIGSGTWSVNGGWTATNGNNLTLTGSGVINITQTDGQVWVSRTSGTSNTLRALAAKPGVVVAVGLGGVIISSPDGITWATQTSGTGNTFYAAAYGAGLFVASGDGGVLRTSPDGATWTTQTDISGIAVKGMVWSGALFVAVGNSGQVRTSADGISWTSQTSGTATRLNGIGWGNGLFVAAGDSGVLITSPDGVTWTSQTSGVATDLNAVTYGAGVYVAVGNSGVVRTSADGVTWTSRTSGVATALFAVFFNGKQFIFCGASQVVRTSPDGITWTSRTSAVTGTLYAAVWAGTAQFIVAGNTGILSSSTTTFIFDGGCIQTYPTLNLSGDAPVRLAGANKFADITNTSVAPLELIPEQSTVTSSGMTWVGSRFVAFSNSQGPSVVTQVYGDVWQRVLYGSTSSLSSPLFYATWTGSLAVGVGTPGIATSTDGLTWALQTSNLPGTGAGVVYGNSLYVVVGTLGGISTSTDATTWTARTSGVTTTLNWVAYGAGTYVAVGNSGVVLTSPDGVTWTPQTSGVATTLSYITYAAGLFVVVGASGVILTSPDGVTWTPQTSGVATSLTTVIYANSLFVTVGLSGVILTSPDGVSWTPQTSGTVSSLQGVAWSGTEYAVSGGASTILTSPDAITWTPALFGANAFDAFSLTGTSTWQNEIVSTTSGTQQTIVQPDIWYVGANSIDGGNNTGLTFSAGGGIDFLYFRDINGKSSGGPIAVYITEGATGSSSESPVGTYNITLAETTTASDISAAQLLYIGTLSESATIADVAEAVKLYLASVSESATSADLISAALTFASTVSELTAASESLAVQSILTAPVSELATAADSIVGGLFFLSGVSEAATAADTAAALLIFNRTISEATTAAEVLAAIATFQAAVPESVVGSDIARALLQVGASVSESLSALDSTIAARTTSPTVSESATSSEAVTNVYTSRPAISESAQVIDAAQVVASTFSAASAETANALDTPQGANTGTSTLAESATGSESNAAAFNPSTQISESAQQSDSTSAVAAFFSDASELATAQDAARVAPSVFSAVALAAAQAAESFNPAGSVYNAVLPIQGAGITDSLIGAFLWNDVDDNQTPNWQNVNNTQTPAWTDVTDTQNPGWNPITPQG